MAKLRGEPLLYYNAYEWADLDVYFDMSEITTGHVQEKSPQYYFRVLGWDESSWKVRRQPLHLDMKKPPNSFYKTWVQLNGHEKETATGKHFFSELNI